MNPIDVLDNYFRRRNNGGFVHDADQNGYFSSGCTREAAAISFYKDHDDSYTDDEDDGLVAVDPSKSTEERLLELTNATNYSIVQRNGQRIYGGPPPDWGDREAPERGSEVFVGKVPRSCIEDEIVPIFSKVGTIYELRLMMDFSGSNRGYFFVRYANREEARRACRELNNFELRPGYKIGVILSVDNRKLWVKGIPQDRTAEEIKVEMGRLTDGVLNVLLYPSQTDKSKTRGYAFVEYETHRHAALARRRLVPGKVVLFGHEIEKVDWAEPEAEVDEEIMKTVRVLHVRNLLPATSEATVTSAFTALSDGGAIEHVKKFKDFAFVHFVERSAAEKALSRSANLRIDGSPVGVQWARPVDRQTHNAKKLHTKLVSDQYQQQLQYQGQSKGYDGPSRGHHASLVEMPTGNNGRDRSSFRGNGFGRFDRSSNGIGRSPFFAVNNPRGGAAAKGFPRRNGNNLVRASSLNPNASSFNCRYGAYRDNGNGNDEFGTDFSFGTYGPMSSPPPPLMPPPAFFRNGNGLFQMADDYSRYGCSPDSGIFGSFGGREQLSAGSSSSGGNGSNGGQHSPAFPFESVEQTMGNLDIAQQRRFMSEAQQRK